MNRDTIDELASFGPTIAALLDDNGLHSAAKMLRDWSYAAQDDLGRGRLTVHPVITRSTGEV